MTNKSMNDPWTMGQGIAEINFIGQNRLLENLYKIVEPQIRDDSHDGMKYSEFNDSDNL